MRADDRWIRKHYTYVNHKNMQIKYPNKYIRRSSLLVAVVVVDDIVMPLPLAKLI